MDTSLTNTTETKVNSEHYYGIDWLRVIACIGIVVMHIRANTNYQIFGWIYNNLIPVFSDFVYLFMAISSFGMLYGYYDKVMNGKVNWTGFYKKRYIKILPFFALLILLDVAINHNISSLLEGITELTLMHGFIPQDLSVIGVGWYLGTVFVFYLTFPFFCVLVEKKSRARLAFIVSIVLHYICAYYFDLTKRNYLFSLCYFLIGGLVFLYREKIEKSNNINVYILILLLTLAVYLVSDSLNFVKSIARILLIFVILSLAICVKCKSPKMISFISKISMEIYLSHMVIFRAVEKVHLTGIIGNGWPQYILTVCLVLIGTIVFSYVSQNIINRTIAKSK